MDSLKRIGKLLIGEVNGHPFAINLDHVVSVHVWEDSTVIKTVINYELRQGSFFPTEWYNEIVKHWVEYVSYGS